MINTNFKSILDLVKSFPDEQTCINHLETLRLNGNVVSPFDETSNFAFGFSFKNKESKSLETRFDLIKKISKVRNKDSLEDNILV